MAENQDTLNIGSEQGQADQSLSPSDAFSAFEGQTTQTDTASDVVNSVIGTPQETTQAQPQQEQPVQDGGQQAPSDNEQVRYQYWQSQAAKAQNELQNYKQMEAQYTPYIDYLKANPQAVMNIDAAQQQVNQPAQEAFPEPPEKPRRPRNFSREDALSDSNSESARYLDDVDEWNEKMGDYTRLQSEYNNAKLQETVQQMQERESKAREAQQAEIRRKQQLGEINQYVIANHGLSQEQASKFVQDMSSPESVSMENLVKLWMANEGIQSNPQNTNMQPSPQFQQTQAAQQVPNPMGVVPAAANENPSSEDAIMDGMLNDYKSRNPF